MKELTANRTNLRAAAYIAMRGYSSTTSPYTLETWLHARSVYRANQKAADALLHVKPAEDYNG